jgi:hypothetical protein
VNQPARRWRINPKTQYIEDQDGRDPGDFTPQEWAQQQWPTCAACGTSVDVLLIVAPCPDGGDPTYRAGSWACPDGCSSRT